MSAPINPVRLNHAGLFVANLDRAERFTTQVFGMLGGESSHGATKSVYGADPDGNEFELMWMLPRQAWGQYENSAPVERFDLHAELGRSAGVRTAGQIVPLDDAADVTLERA